MNDPLFEGARRRDTAFGHASAGLPALTFPHLYQSAVGGQVVLYHCCVSLDRRNEIVSKGFQPDEHVHVTTEPPTEDLRTHAQSHAVVNLGPPFGFSTGDYSIAMNEQGDPGWLVPGAY